jgi:hypothetical protein
MVALDFSASLYTGDCDFKLDMTLVKEDLLSVLIIGKHANQWTFNVW